MNKTLRLLAGMTALFVAVATPAAAFGFLGIDLGLTGDDDELDVNTDIVATDDEADGLHVSVDALLSAEDDGDLTDNVDVDVSVTDDEGTIVSTDDLDLNVGGDDGDDGCDLLDDVNVDLGCDNGADVLDDVDTDLDLNVDDVTNGGSSSGDGCDGLLGDVDLDVEGATGDCDVLGELDLDTHLDAVNEECDGILDDLSVDLEGTTTDASEGDTDGIMIRIQAFIEGILG